MPDRYLMGASLVGSDWAGQEVGMRLGYVVLLLANIVTIIR